MVAPQHRPNIMPWYQRADVRALLRQCMDTPPRVVSNFKRYGRSVEESRCFNPDDPRVRLLRGIQDDHLNPLFEGRSTSEQVRAAGALVTVDMAIDAVLPQPLAGRAGDPGYLEQLPRIDLTMGRAVS